MEAVAHNPSFAKKAGVPQSVGKDFSAADKGRKFQKGGATMMGKKVPGAMSAMMARRPRMGAGMPPSAPPVMPPQPPAPMGMKKGGKVKRYFEGGDDALEGRTDEQLNKNLDTAIKDSKTFGEAFKAARGDGGKTFMWRGTRYTTEIDKSSKGDIAEKKAQAKNPGLAKEIAAENMKDRESPPIKPEPSRPASTQGGTQITPKNFAEFFNTKKPVENSESVLKRLGVQGNVKQKSGFTNFAKGGMAHGGMHKMPNGKMMKNSAMKEGGMPMKDGKPAFMMGKKMNMGGMAKYAKGGGIESRGKTKGTIIRMAAGGSVGSASRRADGIAQRGKTRG
jgi:hypothetical protein